MYKLKTLCIIGVAAALFSIASCDGKINNIFAQIEEEEIIIDRSLNNNLTVKSIHKASGIYFINAGLIYSKDEADTSQTWSEVELPVIGALTHSLVTADFGSGEKFYACFYYPDNSEIAGVFSSPVDPISWSKVNSSFFDTKRIQKLIAVADGNSGTSDALYAIEMVGENPAEYAVYVTPDGTSFTPVFFDGKTSLGKMITDGSSNAPGSGTDVFMLGNNTIYETDTSTLDSFTAVTDAALKSNIYNVCFYESGIDKIIVTASGGTVYTFDTSSWTASQEISNSNNIAINFQAIARHGSLILYGTKSNGYYEAAASTPLDIVYPGNLADSISTSKNYSSSSIITSTVYSILSDPANSKVFLGTASNGLWLNHNNAWNIE